MMTKRLTWAFVIAVALTALANAPADARQQKKHHTTHLALAVTQGCLPDNDGRQHCGGSIHRASESPMGRRIVAPSNGYDLARHEKRGSSVSLSGIVSPELIAKAQEIVADCGSIIVSARAARGYRSNHPIGRAVDLKGNPSCIYAHLQGWPGGMSTDYASAPGTPHVHISYNPGGQEWGLHFVHNHARHHHPHAFASETYPTQ